MTGSVEGAKDVAKKAGGEAAKKAVASKPTPADLLKKAVAGTDDKVPAPAPEAEVTAAATPAPRKMPNIRLDPRTMAAATVALVVGTGFGMVTAPRERAEDTLTRIDAGLEAGRTESARLNGEVERLATTLAAIRESSEASRSEAKALAAGLSDRLVRLEQGIEKKVSVLGEKIDQAERDQGARLAGLSSQMEKRAAMVVPAPTTTTSLPAAKSELAKPEPTQTASIGEAKPKSETVETWAVRDVFNGIAILEDRRRRLVEVGPGDSVPGIGRVESIERRGRNWVVVTKQGLITPQMW